MMKWSVIQKLRALFILVLAVLFTNAVVSYSTTMSLIQNQQWAISSQEVITQFSTLNSSFQNAEITQRKYLLTANPDDLAIYLQARQKIAKNLEILQQLNQPGRNQQLISLLTEKITQKLNILQREISIAQNQGGNAVKTLVLSDEKQNLNLEIQQLIDKHIATEKNQLQQHSQKLQATTNKSITIFLLATFIDLIIVALLYDLLWRYVNKLQHTELDLRQSKNRLRAIIDAEPECIKLIARDGKLLEINACGLAMLEVETAESLIGKAIDSAIAPEYREAFTDLHKRVCQGEKGTLEYEIVGFKGTRRWLETHAVPLLNEIDGTFLHLAVTRDITQRQQAQQKISEQAALLDVATDAILVRNIHNQILFWNQGAERLYGWKQEEVLGQNVVDILYRNTSPQLQDAFFQVIHKGEWRGELQQLTKNGAEVIVESRWTLMRDEKNQPKSILSVSTEITEKKQLEAQLLRSQRLESIGTLAGGIAHDLNNVLAPVLMSVELLQMKLHDQQSQRVLQTLENNVKRGANLLKQVLSFARGIEGKRTIVQIRHLISEIEQIVNQTFPKSITCNVEISENLWYVSGNITQLHQVFMNLVVNARDAMPKGGILKILLENVVITDNSHLQTGSYVVISVMDTGVGISPEIRERIFEPFFTTKDLGKGTGLGLSTALGIIKNHGGFVHVDSEIGKGTTFKVYLPAVGDAYGNLKEERTPQVQIKELDTTAGNGELILLVDDEAGIREITKSSLETYNYRVLTASNGEEAVAIYAQYQQQIDIVLLDMMMPAMDGAIAIRQLKAINPHIKIIVMSGLLSNHNKREIAKMGVRAFLSKPCTVNELLQAINAINIPH
ncbi:PAS domain S-box protein [Calothrix sp. FACHB-1219]|uniref:PAS domain S-box protein n=1 Tax=unclassified Calothrix TaxID=2619626 RepID=UPI0016879F3C|nr:MULTISPECIES: PAS domain S-box protein [unclassified Calothrix]MBD2206825.1 PAS domain S-box protein [Calothrix sp. FACHB-168]MBD2219496.1 PAS domain S-box protein [Calothrix sp. FACHB-1219]